MWSFCEPHFWLSVIVSVLILPAYKWNGLSGFRSSSCHNPPHQMCFAVIDSVRGWGLNLYCTPSPQLEPFPPAQGCDCYRINIRITCIMSFHVTVTKCCVCNTSDFSLLCCHELLPKFSLPRDKRATLYLTKSKSLKNHFHFWTLYHAQNKSQRQWCI